MYVGRQNCLVKLQPGNSRMIQKGTKAIYLHHRGSRAQEFTDETEETSHLDRSNQIFMRQ